MYDDWYYKEILFINERHFVQVLKEFKAEEIKSSAFTISHRPF